MGTSFTCAFGNQISEGSIEEEILVVNQDSPNAPTSFKYLVGLLNSIFEKLDLHFYEENIIVIGYIAKDVCFLNAMGKTFFHADRFNMTEDLNDRMCVKVTFNLEALRLPSTSVNIRTTRHVRLFIAIRDEPFGGYGRIRHNAEGETFFEIAENSSCHTLNLISRETCSGGGFIENGKLTIKFNENYTKLTIAPDTPSLDQTKIPICTVSKPRPDPIDDEYIILDEGSTWSPRQKGTEMSTFSMRKNSFPAMERVRSDSFDTPRSRSDSFDTPRISLFKRARGDSFDVTGDNSWRKRSIEDFSNKKSKRDISDVKTKRTPRGKLTILQTAHQAFE